MSDKRKKYKKYDREFKINAAKLVNEQGMAQTKVAQDLGVSLSLIGKWAKDFATDRTNAFPGQGKMRPLEEENAKLRKELKRAQMQVEILRKATAYFAQNEV
jgi:transposase